MVCFSTNFKLTEILMKFLKAIWDFLSDMGMAKHAAYLARTGRIAEAQSLYKKENENV
jgi:hypothetical protein